MDGDQTPRKTNTEAVRKRKTKFILPARGYYGDIITDLHYKHPIDSLLNVPGATKRTKLIWSMQTERNAPILRYLTPTSKIYNLFPAERWMTFDEDKTISFPVDTFKPKVQLQHSVEPKSLPRSVAIERRRREYQSKDLKKVLKDNNIALKDLVPIELVRAYTDDKTWLSFLPLDIFDDDEYDIRTPENWLEHGIIDNVRHPLPAVAFVSMDIEDRVVLENMYDWVNAAVTDYDPLTKLWTVLTLDGRQKTYTLPRFYVMFYAEDPVNFVNRIKAMLNLRTETENHIRYEFFLDCISLEGILEMDQEVINKIVNIAIGVRGMNKKEIVKSPFFANLLEQLQLNYKRCMGSLDFEKHFAHNADFENLWVPYKVPEKVPERIITGMISYEDIKNYFKWYNIYVVTETYRAVAFVNRECIRIGQMSVFTASFGAKYVTLEEFESIQSSTRNVLLKHLRGMWMDSAVFQIRFCLGDIGKGWFDIKMKNAETYELSKLKRFMELIKFKMQHALRLLVENSINIFFNLVDNPCLPCLDVPNNFTWEGDLTVSQFLSKHSPIFSLQMRLNENGASFSTNPEMFQVVLLKLFDEGLRQLHWIKQVHPFLLQNLSFPEHLYLSSVGLMDKELCDIRDRFVFSYQKALIPLYAYAKRYDEFIPLFDLDVNHYIEVYAAENHNAQQVKQDIIDEIELKTILEGSIPTAMTIGPFHISIDQIRASLIAKRQDVINKMFESFTTKMKEAVEDVITEYEIIFRKIQKNADSIEAIFEKRDFMETVPMIIKTFEETTRKLVIDYDILDFFRMNLSNEDFKAKWNAVGWPKKLETEIDTAEAKMRDDEENLLKQQQMDEITLAERIETYSGTCDVLESLMDYNKVHEIADECRDCWTAMKDAQQRGQMLNQRQKLFGSKVTPFDSLTKLLKEFEPYKNIWVTSSDWLKLYKQWMEQSFTNIDPRIIEPTVTDMYKMIIKCSKIFAEIPGIQEIALEIKRQIDDFKPLIPLLVALRNPGLKDRHWTTIEELTEIEIQISPMTTFKKNFLEQGILEYAERVIMISENAIKEYQIEQNLDKMMAEWDSIYLELSPYKNTGTYIFKVSDEIQQMLDDQIVSTQQISFSPFKQPFEERIDEWEAKLRISSAVIEEWLDVQKQWMYLEPIFSSEDISTQLPVETKKYGSMERTWRRVMRNAHECPLLIQYCGDRKLWESLKDANHILQIVQKGLSEYLEVKRMVFPRFYFLSDDELIEILSQARTPTAVQPHLKKCFENVARLTMEEDMKITQMFSAEDECVNLTPTLYPVGTVEVWLLSVEDVMRNTVRIELGKSIIDLMKKDRKTWVMCWPGQVVIACSQTAWTAGVEKGISDKKLKEFFINDLLVNLDALRNLVKGILTFVQREILSALIVIEVHARDVTSKLVDANVLNVNDFDWISQLRYYWVNNEHMKIRAVNAEFQYGYEYLGNSGRLVITPLTDRCYLTLTGALHLKFGGAPAGPAGTGKTETTKDLAKAMAIQCVVFNCSDQLDFMAMGKFFKGLASSGAWACFDEFNRIDIEVLSVVAQQIATIQKAQLAKVDTFYFEGVEISLKLSCAVFITMNPGYAGRTELPDNLKALFRPVSMMVPDYTLIAEISLFSFGFGNAKQLANKITSTFKLSSEQLSSQDHYDFGMRAVKTVIAVAGNLKREKPKMDERQILLRALLDVNLPKFLKDDLKLFNGIVSDLFPKMVEEAVDYGKLEEAIRISCYKFGLDDVNDYVRKVIQLYETTVVRHGLMLVGPTGSGKTKCYVLLQDAITSLKGTLQPSGYPFQPVKTYVLNPKSITMGQLYGEFDPSTHEWTDGILPCLVRVGIIAENKDKRWYIFDGPVDAIWIENMNTVLDDNKKLCMTSGEIIKLRDTMTMMFEVGDLAVASPATVSRCGMVYIEPAVLGLEPFVTCWLRVLPELVLPYEEELKTLIYYYAVEGIHFLRSKLKEVLISVDSALLISFLQLMTYKLEPVAGFRNPPQPPFLALMKGLLAPWVIFCTLWSIGCTCDNDGRVMFDKWVREKMKARGDKPHFPKDSVCYDYRLHDGGFTDPTDNNEPKHATWKNWMDGLEQYTITEEMKYSDIEVPTVNNVRNSELLGIILINEHNVLCVGPTGTGKTLTVIAKLSKNLPKKFMCDFINFSARTSSNQTQDLIDSKLDRRRRGVFGPPVMKRQVFFIDDFNMPALEVFGAQPPIELIRQWMDFGGWYDRKNIGDFRNIVDVNFVAAMGPTGGGRNPVTPRLLRHFHYLTFLEMEDDSKIKIFGTILRPWLMRGPTYFKSYYSPILQSTLMVYTTILHELLPTPAKTHYTFNLRDLSKVFQGMLMQDSETLKETSDLLQLWYHECCRVFQDRLVNDQDRHWFDKLLRSQIQKWYKRTPSKILGTEAILFGDFIDSSVGPGAYAQIKDFDKLSEALTFYLDDYNLQSTRPMKLVLFQDAINHISRISRILRQPMGNALLLGMGGSGRQSLTRLAAFMAEYNSFQIELTNAYSITDWKDDVKSVMLSAGLLSKETVFLFSDTQIKSESYVEDLNNLLNSGEVPNIFVPEEMDRIYQCMKGPVQELGLTATKSNLFAVYKRMVKSYLHIVLAMSPIGEVFRARLRQFPALVNCCTIDWFSPWPDTALQSVAERFLKDVKDFHVPEQVMTGIVVVFQYMHASVVKASELYLQELSRHNYVTPTSYLELLSSYTELMNSKRGDLSSSINRLQIGLSKLQNTSEEVANLQEQLRVMKPALQIAAKDAEKMIEKIAQDTIVAEETKRMVQNEQQEAIRKAAESEEIAEDAQKDLDEAMPALLAAERALKALNKNDIVEVKSMKKPPAGVVTVVEAICIVKGIKPVKIPGLKVGEKILDYWEPGRAMLSDPTSFLSSLMEFDKESITEEMVGRLKKYVNNPGFTPEKIAKISKACQSLCIWIHAMFKFYHVNQAVLPKKAALKQAEEDLAATEKTLAAAKERMQQVLDGLKFLQESLAKKISEKEEKEQSIILCEDRMYRAIRLINGLAEEKVRWIQTIKNLKANIVNITGDILICSGCVAYLTPFTDAYRRKLFAEWLEIMKEHQIPFNENCSPVSVLGEPVQIRLWQLDGLPRDSLSTDNAVLVACSRRWPLFIDPQGQANKWVKNMGKNMGLTIVKLADKDLMRSIESSIRFGKAVLIENVLEELDPSLDPVLLRQVFLQSGIRVIKLGEVVIPYDDNFKLYLTTKLPNPHYTPEVSIKVLIVNFTVVSSGLQDQLLALVVAQERPDLEEQRAQIVVGIATMKHELKEIQDRILYKLSSSKISPIEDLDFIITLEASKVKSNDINNKVEAAEITQIDIDNTRALYIPVANRAQILFFCVADLSKIDPMYQYSLEWFITIFVTSMADTEKAEIIEDRVKIINNYFTFNLYTNVCRSLFEKNKLHFAFLLCIRILTDVGEINLKEWQHFLAGGLVTKELPNPAPSWLSPRAWNEILSLYSLKSLRIVVNTFTKHIKNYQNIFESVEPHRESLPEEIDSILDPFQKLIVLKSIRPDKVTNAMQDYLALKIGQKFIEPQSSDLSAMYKDSGPTIPLIFVLSTGTDPAADLYKFADRMRMTKRMFSISLGQGQGPRAERLLQNGVEIGSWVFFQNCHLAPSWMPSLERIIENISPDECHRDFRVWLTSTPSPHFPVAILQNGTKMTIEPPAGLKANLMRAYNNQVSEYIEFFQSEHHKAPPFRFLVFSLCLFHGIVIERRKFGPLGFNIPYEFTEGDLKISISQLHMFLVEYEDIPFKVLSYTAGQINYGGRVTDDWDRRCLMNVLADYYKPETAEPGYKFDKTGTYRQLRVDIIFNDYMDFIKSLPINDDPDIFGMHANADITFAQSKTFLCLSTLLQLQPKLTGAGGGSQEDATSSTAKMILEQIPRRFDINLICERYPVLYEESLNTVILQEAIRFNTLLSAIKSSLVDLLKALKGLVVMSEKLEKMTQSLSNNLVPALWASKAYPSLKPLGPWVTDLKARCHFLDSWVDEGIPPAFWISGFYFPQAFLTGTLQNFARRNIVSIDTISFCFEVLDDFPEEKPSEGCCIYGLFVEGCRWNPEIRFLDESRPKELYTDMPVIWLVPEENHKVAASGVYQCPIYKTLTRAGVLSTTGHSTNYVLTVEIPSQQPQRHWIKRGVALICALDY